MEKDGEEQKRTPLDLAFPLRIIVGGLFGAIVVLTIAQVFFRFVLDSPLIWSEELSRLFLVWVTFLGAAVVCWDGTHLSVDTVFSKIPIKARRWLRAFNALVVLGLLFILVDTSIIMVQIEHITTLGSLDIPASVLRAPATVGGGLMIFFIVMRWVYRLGIGPWLRGDDPKINKEPM